MDEVNPKDVWLGDKGYYDLINSFSMKRATLEVPPRSHGKTSSGSEIQMTANEDNRGKIIAKLRITVERLNARIKGYRLTINPAISHEQRYMAIHIAAFLSNYRTPLVAQKSTNNGGDSGDDIEMDLGMEVEAEDGEGSEGVEEFTGDWREGNGETGRGMREKKPRKR